MFDFLSGIPNQRDKTFPFVHFSENLGKNLNGTTRIDPSEVFREPHTRIPSSNQHVSKRL